MSEPRDRRRYWRRIAVATIAAVVMATLFSGSGWTGRPRDLAESILIALVFSVCIGPLLGVVMPRVSPYIWRRAPFPFDWVLGLAVMIVVAMAGSGIAIAVLTAAGRVAPPQFRAAYVGSLRISIVITLVFGVMMTSYEVMRARVERATAEAQLASLEARVQPHFLFNTLNSIAALIHDDPRGAEAMTMRLAALLRSSLDRDEPLVTLDEELRLVEMYLEIERVRFGDRLRYQIDADDDARREHIPRFAVQTLVENSVKYAVSPRRDGGRIDVRAARDAGGVLVTIADDGPGFDPTIVVPRHGLALLRDRLATQFGARAALDIASSPRGTTARLKIPQDRRQPRCTTGAAASEAIATAAREV